MLWYIFPLLLLLSFSFSKGFNNELKIYSAFLVVAFVFCGGYMTGSDWRGYEVLFNNSSWDDILSYDKEKGFYFFMLLFRGITSNFFHFHILVKVLCFFSFFRFYRKFSLNLYLVLFVFLCLQGAFLFVNCPFRNLIAISIFLYAYTFFFNTNKKKFLLIVLVASTFHFTAIVFLFLIFIGKLYGKELLLRNIFIGLVFLSFVENYAFLFIEYFAKLSPYVYGRLDSYLDSSLSRSFYGNGSIFNILCFFLLYQYRNLFKFNKITYQVYIIALVSLMVYRIYYIFPFLSRFYLYLVPFYCVCISSLFYWLFIKGNRIFLWVSIMYCSIMFYSVVISNYAYLPYTNYFVYSLKGELKPYAYRDEFNYDKWYDKK